MAAVSVTTGATLIIAKNNTNPPRIGLMIKNVSANDVYLDTVATVQTTTGYPLPAGDELIMDFDGGISQYFYRGPVYGIAASTSEVRVWEVTETR